MISFKTRLKRILEPTLIGDLLEVRANRKWYESRQCLIPTVEKAINNIQKRWDLIEVEDNDKPIFIFASSWRSGSTLLQRLINSDPNILVWGEPYSDCSLVQNLANSIRCFDKKYPPEYNFVKQQDFIENNVPLSNRWTANLYPDIITLFQAHRNFFKELYAQSAAQLGFDRWGFKEVRLSIEHAIYLKWLFPNAKFIFLYRNPYKAYQSFYSWRNLYLNWPDKAVLDPETFGEYWVEQVTGFLNNYQKVNGFLLKYEDLCDTSIPINQIGDYLDAQLDDSILNKRIGSSNQKRSASKYLLSRLEKKVSPLAKTLGYHL